MHPIYPRDEEGNIKLRPIGTVRSPVKKPQVGGLTGNEADIVLNEELTGCLDGIEEFSHIVVLYWLDRISGYRESCRPQGRQDVPLLGQLATR